MVTTTRTLHPCEVTVHDAAVGVQCGAPATLYTAKASSRSYWLCADHARLLADHLTPIDANDHVPAAR